MQVDNIWNSFPWKSEGKSLEDFPLLSSSIPSNENGNKWEIKGTVKEQIASLSKDKR